jgi:iron complex outermembrane receptor protein
VIRSTRHCLATASILLLGSAPLAAQQEPKDSSRAALDTVVVTASRGEPRSLTQVPFAVSTVSADRWAGRTGLGMDQALQQVPGVFTQSRSGTHDIRLTIRGFGARGAGDRSNAGTSRGIRVLLDGIPETEPDGRTAFDQVDLATIERIEVMRSNGSAAWGNAAGGIVSLSTQPEFTNEFAEVAQQTGSFGLLRTVLRGGTSLGEGKGWLSLTRSTFDGWRDHSDMSRTQAVGGLAIPLSGGGRVGVQLAAASNLFRIPGPLTPAEYAADPQQPNATYASRDERRFNRLMRVGVTLDQPIGAQQDVSAMLFVNPKYLQRSERNTFRDFNRYHIGGATSWGARFNTGATPHRLRIGGDFAYQDGSIQFYDLSADNTRGATLQQNKSEAAQNAGVYVQDEIALTPAITLLLGARYDDLSYFYRDLITPAIDASKRFDQLSPRGGISWRLKNGTNLYASYGNGVEIPAGNETDPPGTGIPNSQTALNPLLDVVRSSTLEAGVRRYHELGGALMYGVLVDAAVYDVTVNGEPMPYNGGRFYLTAGEVQRRGLELALSGFFRGGLTARFAGTFSDNAYDEYVVDSTYLGVPGATADYSGNAVAGLPGRVVNVSLQWQPPAASWLNLELGAQHNSDYFADDRNAVAVPGFTVYRASSSVERALAGGVILRASLAVENLADTRYVGSAFINPDYAAGAPLVYESGLPRSVVLGLTFRRAR